MPDVVAGVPAVATAGDGALTVRLLNARDGAAWRAALPAGASAFGSVEFARIQQEAGVGTAHLVVVRCGRARVAHPVLLRRIGALPSSDPADASRWDATTPPFTGPFAFDDGELDADAVTEALAHGLRELDVVSEFAHLHPWGACRPVLPAALVQPRHAMVYVDLGWDDERVWRASYNPACRKNIRRAQRSGVTVRAGRSDADVAQFHRIYTATMQRRAALEPYRHPLSYFLAFRDLMPDNARFVLAEVGGAVVAATLYLHDDETVYSYLGGADDAYQSVRPTNAVVHDTVRWGRARGKRRLVLGGGYRPDDGIMRFKSTFSPLRAVLPVLCRVHDESAYDRLARGWVEARAQAGLSSEAHGFFPVYRAPVDPSVADDEQGQPG